MVEPVPVSPAQAGAAVVDADRSPLGGPGLRRGDASFAEPIPLAAFLDAPAGATAVRLEPGENARALLPHLDGLTLVEIGFPSFRDGRGYSAARVLREGGYAGRLRAQGDVLVDQVPLMKRCGFDSFAPGSEIDAVTLEAALTRYETVYQKAADGRVPVWALRHGR